MVKVILDISFVMLLSFTIGLKCRADENRSPPKIFKEWKDVDYYYIDNSNSMFYNFTCLAGGTNLIYSLYEDNQLKMLNDHGNFTLEDTGQGLDGIYQCKVKNKFGTSVSDKTELKKAFTVVFGVQNDEYIQVEKADGPAHIKCEPLIKVVPDAVVQWYQSTDGIIYSEIQNNNVSQFDGKDTLYFTNVRNLTSKFRCKATNTFLRTSGNSTSYTLQPLNYDSILNAPIELLTSSSTSTIIDDDPNIVNGLVNSMITLRCLFYARPIPQHDWWKDGQKIDRSLWDLKSDGTEITSKHPLNSSYQGTYTCRAAKSNEVYVDKDIRLRVLTLPSFLNETDRPQDTILDEGGSTTFRCSPKADPPVTRLVWYRNGEPLDSSQHPNYNLDSTGKELTISDVSSAKSDSCVIRCEASNKYGHVSSEGYLLVIEPTKLDKDQYKDMVWVPKQNLKFFCNYTSDAWYPVHCSWFHNNKSINNGDDDRVTVDDKGTLSIITENDDDGGRSRLGTYKVIASNNYSTDSKEFKVIDNVPEPEPNVDKHVTNLWWISLVVIAILFLLLLLLLLFLCCCCRKRQKEDYHVDKKERLMGKDPVKELHSMGFHDYQAQEGKENISYTASSGTLPHIHPPQLPTTYYTREINDSDTSSFDQLPLDELPHHTLYRRSIMSDSGIVMRRDITAPLTNMGYHSGPVEYNHNGVNDLDASAFHHHTGPQSLANYPYRHSLIPYSEV